jgi:hypothetical protein
MQLFSQHMIPVGNTSSTVFQAQMLSPCVQRCDCLLSVLQEANPEAVQVQSHQFKDVRRQIAQLETVLREREMADGITRKQSRSLRREVKVAAGFGNL